MDKKLLEEELNKLEDRLNKNVARQKELDENTPIVDVQPEKDIDPKLREILNLKEVRGLIGHYTKNLTSEYEWQREQAKEDLEKINNSPLEYFTAILEFYSKENKPEDYYRDTEEEYRKIVNKINAINEGRKIEERELEDPTQEIIAPPRASNPEEIRLEENLNQAREKYAEEYKKFMAERKKELSYLKRGIDSVFGGKLKPDEIPPELEALEEEYNKAAILLGNEMLVSGAERNDIFKRVVLQEQEEIAKLKVENLPDKEKGIIVKSLDWYFKQPRWKKLAISTALSVGFFATVAPGTVAAAGGLATFATIRAARGVAGSVIGQSAAKSIDWIFKNKSAEKREAEERELAEEFGADLENNFLDSDRLSYIKEKHSHALEGEKIRKTARILAKAGVGILAGGLSSGMAGYGTGKFLHDVPGDTNIPGGASSPTETATGSPSSSSTSTPSPSPSPNVDSVTPKAPSVPQSAPGFTNEGVKIEHGKGAIAAIKDLQNQIKTQYPDISKAPADVQDFMKADATKEAIKLGFYDPSAKAESALIQEGSVLKFQDGKIVLGKTNASGEFVQWNKKMIDTDSKPKVVEHRASKTIHHEPKHISTHKVEDIKTPPLDPVISKSEVQIGETITTGKTVTTGQEITTGKTVRTGGETVVINEAVKADANPNASPTPEAATKPAETATPKPSPTAEELSQKIKAQMDLTERHPELKGTPFSKNTSLPEEKLVEANKVYQENIVRVSDGNTDKWSYVKDVPAKNFLGQDSVEGDKLVPYLNKLKEISGLNPEYNILDGNESIEKYVIRVHEWAAKNNKLPELKNINLKR